jgi:hypothetical protein
MHNHEARGNFPGPRFDKLVSCSYAAIMRKPFQTLLLILWSLGFVGLGLWMFGYYCSRVWLAHESLNWPSTTGQIISSTICEHHYKGVRYSPCVTYRYALGERSFESKVIVLGHRDPGTREEAAALTQNYFNGREVAVFYRPNSPEIACLEPGIIPWETYIPMILSPLPIGIGLLVLRANRLTPGRRRRNRYG